MTLENLASVGRLKPHSADRVEIQRLLAAAEVALDDAQRKEVSSGRVRDIIESRDFTDLATNPFFSTRDFRAVPEKYRVLVPDYIKDYVSLNQFVA